MNAKVIKGLFIGIGLLIVILFFTIFDYLIHGLQGAWGVPDYYFRNKIPFGYLWAAVGFFLAIKVKNIWAKALIVAGTVAVILQARYFLEGYDLGFVFIFLLFHFLILYPLLVSGFWLYNKYVANHINMNKILIVLVAFLVAALGTYYIVFSNRPSVTPTYNYENQSQPISPETTPQSQTFNTPTTPTPQSAPTASVAAQSALPVHIKDFAFAPTKLTVKNGAKVIWINNDTVAHTVTSDMGSLLNSSTIAPGKSFSFTFTAAGSVKYHCAFHPNMKGEIIVTD